MNETQVKLFCFALYHSMERAGIKSIDCKAFSDIGMGEKDFATRALKECVESAFLFARIKFEADEAHSGRSHDR